MRSSGLPVLVLLFTGIALGAPQPEPGFWKTITQPKASWLLDERASDPGSKPSKIRVETYDCRTVADASVARLRWTHILESGSKDIGDSDLGRYTQVAVTPSGIYLLSADMDDTAVIASLKHRPSRSDPPRAYLGSHQNQGRFLRIEDGNDGPIACMGAPTARETDWDPMLGEVCFSAQKGVVFLGGGYAPAGKVFTQPGYEKRPLTSPPKIEPSASTMDTLLVAGDNGIQEVDLNGKVLRTISKNVARDARYLAKRDGVLFLGPDDDLWLTMLVDGTTKRIAKLPKKFKSCEDMPDYPKGYRFARSELGVQDESDFKVDQDGERICLSLADRNMNMQNFRVELLANVKTGKVTSYGTGCPGIQENSPACHNTDCFRFQPVPINRTKAPYGLTKGRLIKRETDGKSTRIAKLGDGDFEEERLSPTGTWVAIKGNQSDGDYIHFDLLLLNRVDGRIWPVGAKGMAPLTAKQIADLGKQQVETLDVVGETSIRWVPGHDLLLIDGKFLITPGVGQIELPGIAVF